MSFRRAAFGFALPVSLALACAACGPSNHDQSVQNEPAPAMTAPATPMAQSPMSQTPPPSAMATMPAPMTTAGNAMGGGDFNMLAGAKGYITQSDAMQDHWMNNHFKQCDSDHDGKVTHAEYDVCHQPNASSSMMQPPPGSGR